VTGDDSATTRARLAALEAALVRLRGQYDVLMSAFKFDEARALAAMIEAAERERAALAASLPPAIETAARAVPRRLAPRRHRRR
jgi:hypothetical protein